MFITGLASKLVYQSETSSKGKQKLLRLYRQPRGASGSKPGRYARISISVQYQFFLQRFARNENERMNRNAEVNENFDSRGRKEFEIDRN